METDRVSEAFFLCVDLAMKQGNKNIKDKLVDVTVDETWSFRVNGHAVEKDKIPAYHLSLSFNGWPAGIFGPKGGIIAADEAANEEALVAALRKAGASLPEESE